MKSLAAGFGLAFLLIGEVEDADVAQLQSFAMTAETDKTVLVEEAGMALVVDGIGIGLALLGGHIVSLTSLTDIAVEDDLAVHGDSNVVESPRCSMCPRGRR